MDKQLWIRPERTPYDMRDPQTIVLVSIEDDGIRAQVRMRVGDLDELGQKLMCHPIPVGLLHEWEV